MKKFGIIILVLICLGIVAYYYLIPTTIVVNDEIEINTPNRVKANSIVNEVKNEKIKNNPSAVLNSHIDYKMSKKKDYDYKKAKDILSNEISAQIPCTVILIDNKPLVGLPTKDEAGSFMLMIKNKFKLPNCEEPEIKENVTIDNSSCSVDLYCKDAQSAIEKVFDPKNREVEKNILYIVKKGDTLSGIASKYKISISDIKANNPNLKTLRPGTKLNIKGKVLKPVGITVITRKNLNTTVTIPAPVVKVSSVKIPFGKQKVIYPGKSGKKRVEGYIVFENGVKMRQDITFEEVLVQPVAKQIAVGI